MTTAAELPDRVVALDGPSGSGKSTVARGVARRLGWRYVDTGATYRAATVAALRAGARLDDPAAVLAAVRAATIELATDPDAPVVRLDGADVSEDVRGAAATAAVSAVSAVPEVRAILVALQRELIGAGDAVVEGRDICAVVAPSARVKVFLDADPQVRASRRAADSDPGVDTAATAKSSGSRAGAGGEPADLTGADVTSADVTSAVAADLARRDRLDSTRSTSPLAAAPDAVHIDATSLDAAAVVERVLDLVRTAGLHPA